MTLDMAATERVEPTVTEYVRQAARIIAWLCVGVLVFPGWPAFVGFLQQRWGLGQFLAAAALVPYILLAGGLMAWKGSGHNLPPPGDYTPDQLPLYVRYRPIGSVADTKRFTLIVVAFATAGALIAALSLNWGIALILLSVAISAGGCAYAYGRSTQHSGRGPRLWHRLFPPGTPAVSQPVKRRGSLPG